jgi:hypothetical protein
MTAPDTDSTSGASLSDLQDAQKKVFDDQVTRFRGMIDTLRSRAELSAKGVGALGLTVLGGIGYAKFGDIFPLPPNRSLHSKPSLEVIGAGVLAVVSFLAMGAIVLEFAARLWRAQQPITVTAASAGCEQKGLRSERLARVAARLEARGSDGADVALRQALLLQSEVYMHIAEKGIDTVRSELHDVMRWGVRGGVALLAGLALFAIGTDYVAGQRTDTLDIAKACAGVRKVDATFESTYCIREPKSSPPKVAQKPDPVLAVGSDAVAGGQGTWTRRIGTKLKVGDEVVVLLQTATPDDFQTRLVLNGGKQVVAGTSRTTADSSTQVSWLIPATGPAQLEIDASACPCPSVRLHLSVRAASTLRLLGAVKVADGLASISARVTTSAGLTESDRCVIERRSVGASTWVALRWPTISVARICHASVPIGSTPRVQFRVRLVGSDTHQPAAALTAWVRTTSSA